jgi:methyl-accepting chemotaxis protein
VKIRTKSMVLNIITMTVAVLVTTVFLLAEIRSETARQATIAQESRIRTFWELLKSKGNDFRIVDGKLMAGSYVTNGNYELPDKIKEIFGGTATIFMGDTRVSTNVLKEDGNRAVGTKLQGLAYDAIFKEGKPYRGETTILGIPYFTAYDPIRNDKGETIGVLYVGVKKSDFFATYDSLKVKVFGVAAALILLFTVIVAVLVRHLLQALADLTRSARRIADGNLDEEVRVESGDEIGTLAEALNTMTTVIVRNLKGEIEKSSRLINSIKEATNQLSSSASEMMAISAQQSSGATEQASAVQEVTTTSEEIAITAKHVMDNARSVETMAEETTKSCTAGTWDVTNAIEGMERVKSQVQSIAESMLQLGDNSQKIGGIVEIIDEISDQTNLLALNAAIEAAGAGEAGKRFAIVAQEVKRLAERTVDATRQIKGLIEEIQKATTSTIMVTEEGTKAVDKASTLVDKVQASFTSILGMVEETSRTAKEITHSTQQQTSACEQMAETMTEVRDVALQVANSARETEKAVGEIMGLTGSLNVLVQDEA